MPTFCSIFECKMVVFGLWVHCSYCQRATWIGWNKWHTSVCFQEIAHSLLMLVTWKESQQSWYDKMISIWHAFTYYMNATTYAPLFRPPLLGFWKMCIVSPPVLEENGKHVFGPIYFVKICKYIGLTPFLSLVVFWVDERNHYIHDAQINQHEYAKLPPGDVIVVQCGYCYSSLVWQQAVGIGMTRHIM